MKSLPDFPVLRLLAQGLYLAGRQASPTEMLCLAWVLRNRMKALPQCSADSKTAPDELAQARTACCGLLEDLDANPAELQTLQSGFNDFAFCRAFGYVCLVWEGTVPDPTGGATRLHRHDRQPVWATAANPTALIGPFIFFRPEPLRPDRSSFPPAGRSC